MSKRNRKSSGKKGIVTIDHSGGEELVFEKKKLGPAGTAAVPKSKDTTAPKLSELLKMGGFSFHENVELADINFAKRSNAGGTLADLD